jgi:type VI protein secretion system component Hcp
MQKGRKTSFFPEKLHKVFITQLSVEASLMQSNAKNIIHSHFYTITSKYQVHARERKGNNNRRGERGEAGSEASSE